MRRLLAAVAIVVTPLMSMLIGANLAGRLHGQNGSTGILIAIFAMAGFFVGLAFSGLILGSARARRHLLEESFSRL